MGGFYGINAKQRKVIDNAFEFVVIEPNKIIQREGDNKTEYLYVVLRGQIDIRKILPAKKEYRVI